MIEPESPNRSIKAKPITKGGVTIGKTVRALKNRLYLKWDRVTTKANARPNTVVINPTSTAKNKEFQATPQRVPNKHPKPKMRSSNNLEKKTKFYQASTSELYGLVQETPQKESTPFYPRSPYAVAKLYAYWIAVNYRESYGMYACNGILFNHESPRRGETFVTRKITRGLCNIAQGLENCLYLGNMDALRDWGHAKDYVRMQWMMLQQDTPEDFVIATGFQHSVREFIKWSAAELGVELEFKGSGENEIAVVAKISGDNAPALQIGDVIVKVDSRYFRPSEVETLLGDPSYAKTKLGWIPEITAQDMCAEMVREDLKNTKRIVYANQQPDLS